MLHNIRLFFLKRPDDFVLLDVKNELSIVIFDVIYVIKVLKVFKTIKLLSYLL